ncbi:hypothetical protein [Alicyclobacillus sendaiensis]|uniref:hypothetical protein n=1 Tax=Alicyclobacillus sendaiensis TaxID=192387 RepID=UPI000783788F|nr:hypothetical protein [Alicyclobacillus sendaiensis]
MWETLILAVVCVVLLAMLYAVSGGWRTHPGVKGFFRWTAAQLRLRGAGSGPSRNALRVDGARGETAGGGDRTEARAAIQVLEEMYREWDQRSRDLEVRIQALEAAVAEIAGTLGGLREGRRDGGGAVGEHGAPARTAALSEPVGEQKARDQVAGEKPKREAHEHVADVRGQERDGAQPGAQTSREMLYFSILDLLHEGRTRDEIRNLLGVSADEIAMVEKLLHRADGSDSGVH